MTGFEKVTARAVDCYRRNRDGEWHDSIEEALGLTLSVLANPDQQCSDEEILDVIHALMPVFNQDSAARDARAASRA